MKIGKLKAEPKTEWRETELEDVELLVSGLKTLAFRRKLEKLLSAPTTVKQIKFGGEREAEARNTAFHRAVSETVIHGWKNVTEDDGTPIPFSSEIAFELISEVLPFRDAVITAATEIDTERFAVEEDTLGNSSSTSVGG